MKLKNKIEILLPTCVFFFFCISILSIYSAQSIISNTYSNLYIKQSIWFLFGITAYILCRIVKNDLFFKYSKYIYYFSILLLILVLFIGKEVNSSKAWISFGIINIQPSEIAKLSLILYLSYILNNYHFKSKKTIKEEIKLIINIFLVTLIPSFLSFIEPDTGSVIIYIIIALTMTFISGVRIRWFIILLTIILLICGGLIYFYIFYSETFISVFGNSFYYRFNRIIDWKSTSGMQLENSMISIGSAGLKGFGFRNNPLYIPEPYNDFIFAIYTANFGFVGSIILIGIITLFDIKLTSVLINTSNTIEKYMIGGFLITLLYAQIQNIAMTVGILPITGIPLPFISYGGSSLIINCILLSLSINSIYPSKKNKKKHKF